MMDGRSRDRDSITPTELDVVLNRIAAIEHGEPVSPEDLLDYVEGRASQTQVEAVHHALAHSASLRAEFFDFLQELSDFDVEALNAALLELEDEPVPAMDVLGADAPGPRADHDSRRGVTRLRPWHKWGGALAAAAALVLMLRPFGSETPSLPSDAGPMLVVAATRAFDPGVRRGLEDNDAVAMTLGDVAEGWVAIWIPESWTELSESSLSVTASIDGDAAWEPISFQVSTHGGDPAVLVRFDRSRLHEGVLALSLRKEADGPSAEREVVARFRLEKAP
jgi:hypothetical protein